MNQLRAESRRLLCWCVRSGEFTQSDAQTALGMKQASVSHMVVRLVQIGALDVIREKNGPIPSIYIATEQALIMLKVQPKPTNGYVKKANRPRNQFAYANSVFSLGAP